ncbi:MAG: N-acetylmuramoyl-L-alanine amidase [Myxococcota bacterium]
MRTRRRLVILILLCTPIWMGVERPKGLGDVRDIRMWSYPDYTRVVVELTRPVTPRVGHLPADSGAARPERLYIDLDGIWVGRDYLDAIPVEDGLLESIRLGQNTLQRTRVVLDLQRYQRHRLLTLRSPDRVVIDVYGTRRFPETLRWPDSPDRSGSASRLSMPLRTVNTVVIDPGHGGRDPGAIGLRGIREKDVNLALASRLSRILRTRGFSVVMTREKDRTLDLEERTALAESAGGDLFVSIHANASPQRKTRGIEIYYLDENDDRHNLEVAARENGIAEDQVDQLQQALAQLRVSEASAHSQRLAETVHDVVVPALARRYGGMPDLGVKTGPFYVLFLSSMPAILVETGFLTNREDARLLRSDGYLDSLAEQIAAGLVEYRDRGNRIAQETRW